LLAYKTIRFGKELKVVNESWTSKTCHVCGQIADFGGLSGLSVREWTCGNCGESHDRDVNAARNILRIGHDTLERESLQLKVGEDAKALACGVVGWYLKDRL
jgi:putative transposase